MQSVYARVIYTGLGVVKERYVNFEGNKIASISERPEGEVLYKAEVVTPAFIDPTAT